MTMEKLKVQIVSDLHIEYKNDEIDINPLDYITPSCDTLILAGDIGSFYKIEQLTNFLTRLCTNFKIVIYVPGNHEYYTVDNMKPVNISNLTEIMYNIEKNIQNLYILNKSSITIGDICISGCTLWSALEIKIPKFLVRIHGINNQIYERKHENELSYIKKMIEHCNKNNLKLVVITHYCPSYKALGQSYKRFPSLYVSNLDYLLSVNKVHTWICGHIHKNFNFITEGGTRLVGNQKGKPKDKINDYKKDFVIEI